jgi:ATP-dependent Clp protease protease subunit
MSKKIGKKTKEFYLFGDIDGSSLELMADLREMKSSPNTNIKLVICSPGGEENVGYAIYDTLVGLPNFVITEGYGEVSSIAALIFQAGDLRQLSPNSVYMMHNGIIEVQSNVIEVDKIKKMSETISLNNLKYTQAISTRSGVKLEQIEEWCKNEVFFNAKDALGWGLADKIITKV